MLPELSMSGKKFRENNVKIFQKKRKKKNSWKYYFIFIRSCCPGFEPDGQGQCQAICEKSCGIHGKCVEPNVCRCNPGFSGAKCDIAGCPGEFFRQNSVKRNKRSLRN